MSVVFFFESFIDNLYSMKDWLFVGNIKFMDDVFGNILV